MCRSHILDVASSLTLVVCLVLRLLYSWGKSPGTNFIGGWLGPRAGLDDVEKKHLTLLDVGLQPLSHLACGQSLYQLCYPRLPINMICPVIIIDREERLLA
jgi:hypothetical protein